MLIESIKISSHPGIGDLQLYFGDDNGKIFRTVVLAGANGTGKTVVLEAIFSLLMSQQITSLGEMEVFAGISLSEKTYRSVRGLEELTEQHSALALHGAQGLATRLESEAGKLARWITAASEPPVTCFYSMATIDFEEVTTSSITAGYSRFGFFPEKHAKAGQRNRTAAR